MTEARTKRGLDYISGAFCNVDPDDDGSERDELIRSLTDGPPLPGLIIIAGIGLGFFAITAYYMFVAQMTVGWVSMLVGCVWSALWIASDIRGYIDARYLHKHQFDMIRDHLIANDLASHEEFREASENGG